jgi:outer membrane receptor protein involved in Fe transport
MIQQKIASFVCILYFLFPIITTAQKSIITGVVIDKLTKQSIEYASVVVLAAKDSAIVSGVVTSNKGSFNVANISPGTYIIKAYFLGYELNFVNNVNIIKNQQLVLDTITLTAFNKDVNTVTVTSKLSNNYNKFDKQIYKAEQFELAKGGTSIDVLKNLPGVSVNGLGEINVRGSTGFLVLVNGKPIVLDAPTLLSQLPANTIENIEIITAPSAKYDADGKAGIIHIITKKSATDGKAVVTNLQGGLPATNNYHNLENPQRFGGDITLNMRQQKWDISVSVNYLRNDVNGHRDGDVYTKNFVNNSITRFPSSGERSFDKYNYAARTSLVFTPDKNNTFSIGFFAGKKFQTRRADLVYHNATKDFTTNNIIHQLTYFNSNLQTKEGNFILGNFDYNHIFDNKSSLTSSVQYERANLFGNTINNNFNYPDKDVIFQQVYNPYTNPIEGYRLKVDYNIAIGKGKLEAGYQYKYDKQDGQFDYVVTPPTYQTDIAKFKGSAKAINTINAGYVQYSNKINKLQYVVGLRDEYAIRTLNLSYDVKPRLLDMNNLYPSANLLYTINNFWNIKTSYSKRVQRNNNFELNPIPEREHSETLEQGDPDLLPQFVDLVELGVNHSFTKGSFFSTLYFQNIKNPIQRVNSVYADTILNRVFTNADKARLFGLEIGVNLKPTKWFTFYLGTNIYNYKISGNINVLGVVSTVDNANWMYSINSNSSFDLGKKWMLQATVNYLSNRPTAQGEDARFLSPNTSIKKTFLSGKCSIGLQWQNMNLGFMDANKQRITTFGKDFYTTTNYIYETDVLLLNFNINFNKLTNTKTKLPSSEIGEKEF